MNIKKLRRRKTMNYNSNNNINYIDTYENYIKLTSDNLAEKRENGNINEYNINNTNKTSKKISENTRIS